MIITDSNGKQVYVRVSGRYVDDLEITDAYYIDDDTEVSDDEIDFIMDNYQEEMSEAWFENQCSMADDIMDRMKDGD
jgi:hypothetical protein